MDEREKALLSGLDEMIRDAPGVGLCALPLRMLRTEIERLIETKNAAIGFIPHTYQTCGAKFEDCDSDDQVYCAKCRSWKWSGPPEGGSYGEKRNDAGS